ncbi:hypothetical protein E4T56_gene17204 [Termitomyces sp. T112]|nr:hypothetical protein E4T56_gene17204 [Termitomyces sp. T112]
MVASSETKEDSHAVEDNTIPMPSCIIAHASLSQTGPTIPMSPLSSETKLYVKDGNDLSSTFHDDTMTRFGDFEPLSCPHFHLCRPARCLSQPALTGVGINPQCFIAPTFDTSQPSQHLGNITKDIASTFSFVLTLALIWLTHRRKAAVGRIKLRSVYAITLLLNAITTGAFLQGSAAFVVLTALHVSFVAAFFWGLLANAIVATQFPYHIFSFLIFALGTYLALDTALGATTAIGSPPQHTPLRRPLHLATRSTAPWRTMPLPRFVRDQPARVVFAGQGPHIDGSFLAIILETAAIGVLFLVWRSIPEDSWDDDAYYPATTYPTYPAYSS